MPTARLEYRAKSRRPRMKIIDRTDGSRCRVRVLLAGRRMTVDREMPEMVATLVTPGASEWLALSDDLLAGLVHALNNRVTALSVCAELAGLGDLEMVKEGVLQSEVARLQRVSVLIGCFPARGVAEALDIGPVLDDALAIHSHHPRTRRVECTVHVGHGMQPVRAPRWALLRLLLVIMDAAKGGAQEAGRGSVSIELTSDVECVRLKTDARGNDGAYAVEMAAVCGGVLLRESDSLVLTLPSLIEVRRRERTAHGSI